METFLYLAGLRESGIAGVLRASRGGLRHLFETSLGISVDLDETVEGDGALLVARQPGTPAPVVETARSDAFVVVTYGRAGDGAGAILAALSRRPVEAVVADVTMREGCFGCMIHDRRAGVLQVFGDLLGQRTLRWAEAGGAFAVAPHDVALAATGLVLTEPDPVSLASVRAAGWSIGDIPLILGASVVRAGEIATLAPARLAGRARPSFVVGNTARRAREGGEAPAEIAIRYLRQRIGDSAEVEVEIDGGLDSRAALAAAVALRGAREITGRARGAGVDVARQVCRRAGVRFEPCPDALPDPDTLAAAWSRAAAACNGTIDPRALAMDAGKAAVTICGDGGIALGTAPGRRIDPGLPERIASAAGVPEDIREPLARRVRTAVRRLGAEPQGLGPADRFDRAQRWGVAGQALARDPVLMRRASPFQSRELLRAVDAAPDGEDVRRALIERAFPDLLHMPVWAMGGAGPGGALLRVTEVILDRAGGAFLCARDAPRGGTGAAGWRDLGARRFLRICRDVADAARVARVRAGPAAGVLAVSGR